MKGQPPQHGQTHVALGIDESSTIYRNVAQDVILTTEDKLRLRLIEHQNALKSLGDWVTPAGILVPLATTLLVTEFKQPFLGLKPEFWNLLYILSSFGCAIWLIVRVVRAVGIYRSGQSGIDRVIQRIKQASQT
jgi:hypothetical protein